jgi:hypothetical protein
MYNTHKDLRQIVERLNKLFDMTLEVDRNAQGCRLFDRTRGRDVSPRLRPRDFRLWLEGFEEGLDLENRILQDQYHFLQKKKG